MDLLKETAKNYIKQSPDPNTLPDAWKHFALDFPEIAGKAWREPTEAQKEVLEGFALFCALVFGCLCMQCGDEKLIEWVYHVCEAILADEDLPALPECCRDRH
jgi:hypothetical protein